MNLTRRICLAIGWLALPSSFAQGPAQGPKTVTVTKCQNCSTKAGKTLQTCMAAHGNPADCQAAYKKKMTHCNKKYCNAKTTKVKIQH